MHIQIKEQITIEELKEKLTVQFPHYHFSFRTKNLMVVKKSSITGTLVMVEKQKVVINEGFPTISGQLMFIAGILLLGVVAPIIVYYSAFFPAQRRLTKELIKFLKQEYGVVPVTAK